MNTMTKLFYSPCIYKKHFSIC